MSRDLIKLLFYQISRPFPFKLIRGMSNQKFIFPFYHIISDAPSPLVKHLYPVTTVKQFIEDLGFLQQYFTPATFDEVLAFAGTKKHTGKPKFFLSFDDGLSECYHTVFPLLKERKLQAAFFINPAFTGNKMLSHRQKVSMVIEFLINDKSGELLNIASGLVKQYTKEDVIRLLRKSTIEDSHILNEIAALYNIEFKALLQQFKPFMDIPQLKELRNNGFIIGSHSYDHPEFNLLSENDMKEQIFRSFDFLTRELNIKERVFSFPFHDIGVPASFFHFLQNEADVKVSFGTSGLKQDTAPGHIHRIPMELKGFHHAKSILRSEYFYYLVKALLRKNLVKRK